MDGGAGGADWPALSSEKEVGVHRTVVVWGPHAHMVEEERLLPCEDLEGADKTPQGGGSFCMCVC